MTLGTKIRTLRKKKKLSMKALGSIIGVSEQAVGQYERNEREPSLKILNKLAEALEVSGTIFFDNAIDNNLITAGLLDSNEEDYINCIEGLNKDNIDRFISPLPDELKSAFYSLFYDILYHTGLGESLESKDTTITNFVLDRMYLSSRILSIIFNLQEVIPHPFLENRSIDIDTNKINKIASDNANFIVKNLSNSTAEITGVLSDLIKLSLNNMTNPNSDLIFKDELLKLSKIK